MANLETGASTSNTSRSENQVYLSSRGLDTSRAFTNFLHQALVDVGIRVFINDKGLRPGERISDNLLQVIDNSKLYIPIFSIDYASSHRCLDELARMVENNSKHKEDGKENFILPIFYNVKSDDVKLKTKLYEDAISNLEQKMEDQKNKFSPKDIETWRQALKEVGRTKGWELEKYSGSYVKLIRAVVDEVVRLKTRQRHVPEIFVGMEDQIAAINNLLDVDPGGVQLIGIHGMGGIGKTTLAKIIFNQLCPRFGRYYSFVDDVRQTVETKGLVKGLVKLQKKILIDVAGVEAYLTNVDHGTIRIEETICSKKVLIVLDDVDKADHIQKLIGKKIFYTGTRILVTTRDKNILIGNKYNFVSYEMMGLSGKNALKLFSRHAFNNDSPLVGYRNLSMGIINTTYGLPLALQAIGSSLFGKRREIWVEHLQKLKEAPHKDVLATLKISYDALEPYEQEIFLDIACFLVGENKTNPMYMWEDCKFYPESSIKVLINKCMIKVLDDNSFWMHDHFKDLGRKIAKIEGTRLWDKDDIIRNLKSTEIKRSVQALRLPSRDPITVTSKQIKLFQCMRFLWLDDVICRGDFAGSLSELKWIDLHYPPGQCSEATDLLHLENVVVANLHWLDFTEDAFDSLIKGRKLKVLTLVHNRLVHRTPTFPEYSVLEKLTITGCRSLMEIDCSIGNLWQLTDLIVESCPALRNLPEQIGELQNLRHLSLMSCHNLIELPDSISQLVSLTKLDVSCTRITRLPDSISRLPLLSSLDVSFTPIAEMPSTMSKFLHLHRLNMDPCHGIRELPMLPTSLTALRLRSTSLLTVPNLSYLANLDELLLSDVTEDTRTSNVIQTCDLRWIGRLSRLSKLHFCFSNGCTPATELGSLSRLKELTLYGLELQTFEQLPSNSLEKVTVKRNDFKTLAFKSMKRPRIEDCKSSEGLVCLSVEPRRNELQAPELTYGWRGVFLIPSSLKMLREFHLSKCPDVRDIQFVSTLESLEEFSVSRCISLKRLGSLSKVKNLKQLHIDWCENLQAVDGIYELEFLHKLKIHECRSMKRIFDASRLKLPKESIEIS